MKRKKLAGLNTPSWNGETLFQFTLDEARVQALAAGVVPDELRETCADMLTTQGQYTFVIREPREQR